MTINISAVSKNGRSQTLLGYHNRKNADMVNVIPNMADCRESECTFNSVNYYTLTIDLSGSLSGMYLTIQDKFDSYEKAQYILMCNLRMLGKLNNEAN